MLPLTPSACRPARLSLSALAPPGAPGKAHLLSFRALEPPAQWPTATPSTFRPHSVL